MLENVTLRLEGVTPRLSPSHARISPSHVSTSSPMQWGLPYTRRRRVGLRLVRCFMPSVAAETNGFCRPSYQSTRIWCSHNSNSELSNSRAGSVLSNSEDDCAQVGNQRRDRKREKLVYEIELDEIEIARLKSLFFIQSAVLILMGIVVIIWGGTTVYGLWMIFCTNKIGKSAGNNLLKSFLSESFLSQFSSALKFVHNTMTYLSSNSFRSMTNGTYPVCSCVTTNEEASAKVSISDGDEVVPRCGATCTFAEHLIS